MRILYDISVLEPVGIDPACYTGVQRVVHKVAQGLTKAAGIEMSLFARPELVNAEAFAKADHFLAQVPIIRQQARRYSRTATRLINWAKRRGGPGNSLGEEGQRRNVTAAGPTARVLARYDIFHSPAEAFPETVRRSRRIKRFLTVYDLSPVRTPQYTIEPFRKAFSELVNASNREDYFFCISQSTKDDWCEYTGFDPGNCFVTPLAADPSFRQRTPDEVSDARRRHGIPEDANYFLGTSTLEPRKNIAAVIRAFFQLIRETKRQDLYLVLAGREGWKTEAIFEALDTHRSLRSQIIMTGYIPESDLSALYTGARAFVYLSFFEGFGLPPLEAMQCGAPVICSNSTSLPEVVGRAGLLLDPTDQDGLCAALLRLLNDDSLAAKMTANSLRQATKFSWDRCVRETARGYECAVGHTLPT